MPKPAKVGHRRACTHVGEPHAPGTCPSKHTRAACCPHPVQHKFDSAEWQRERRGRVRALVLAHYGGQCVCCGIQGNQFLSLDHKAGDGKEHREVLPYGRQTDMYRWAFENNYPDILQILCFNCNYARNYYGGCH